jgi:chloramphenicol 3-O-phosphotransferase
MPAAVGPSPAVARVLFVAGAPGAGKSAVAAALLERGSEALVFDADWLLDPASLLVGRSLLEASDRWPAYGALWLRVLAMVARNGRTAVHFGRVTPAEAEGLLRQLRQVPVRLGWCRLDCDDATRTARLAARGWAAAPIAEALAVAQALRHQIPLALDTSRTTPEEAAALVERWIRSQAPPTP